MGHLDPEFILAGVIKDYLVANVEAATQADCPIVDFTDPMSIDDANRCVVMVPSGTSDEECQGNVAFEVAVGIKSQWQQSNMAADYASHRARVKEIRGWLWATNLAADLETVAAGTIGIAFVQPKRTFQTRAMDGWLYTETGLTVNIYTKDE